MRLKPPISLLSKTQLGQTSLLVSGSGLLDCTDCIDFDDMEDTLNLDAALTVTQTTNIWTQSYSGAAKMASHTMQLPCQQALHLMLLPLQRRLQLGGYYQSRPLTLRRLHGRAALLL